MGMLEGKAVVVTGSGRGIGAEYAKECARHGAKVVVNDIDADVSDAVAAEIVAAGGTAVSVPADVRRAAEASRLIDTCVENYGRIDGLVNNAGLFFMGFIETQDERELRDLMDTNVIGTFLCSSAAVKHMKKQGSGSIVNITSGAHAGIAMMGAYAATKGAVASATYTWAQELQGSGIRVNAVSPQARTRMSDYTTGWLEANGLPLYPGTQPEAEENTPAAVYLLSDQAADVTGQILRIEGSQVALMTHPCVMVPFPTQDRWTAEDVAAAFEKDLKARQQPTGIHGMQGSATGLASVFWTADEG